MRPSSLDWRNFPDENETKHDHVLPSRNRTIFKNDRSNVRTAGTRSRLYLFFTVAPSPSLSVYLVHSPYRTIHGSQTEINTWNEIRLSTNESRGPDPNYPEITVYLPTVTTTCSVHLQLHSLPNDFYRRNYRGFTALVQTGRE